MEPRRRLLFLLPFAPRLDASHGGARAMAQLLGRLAERHAVALLYLRAADDPPVDDLFHELGDVVEAVVRPARELPFARRCSRRGRLAAALLGGQPLWASAWAVPAYGDRVRALVRTWRPEIVQLEYLVMGQYLASLDDCPAPRLLTLHEPGVDVARAAKAVHRGLARGVAQLDGLAWARFEPRVLEQVHAAVVFTDRDRETVRQLAPETLLVRIPLGTTVPEHALDPAGREPSKLLFFGSLFHPPNLDAALRLAHDILPLVRQRFPAASLDIVGDEPSRRLQRLASHSVAVTGPVPDLAPYLDRAAVVVVPIRLGGGMRLKVMDALAAGKAIVASPRAVEGLHLRDGEHVLLAETDQQFSDAVVQLLDDPARRAGLGTRARAWACANLDWDRCAAGYEALYTSLLEQSGGARAA